MKSSAIIISMLWLLIMSSSQAMKQDTAITQRIILQNLYLEFFDAAPYELSHFDTTVWGKREWDAACNQWRYETGITVQSLQENDQVIETMITFPNYDPIIVSGNWQDKRFARTDPSSSTTASSSSLSVSTETTSFSVTSSLASSSSSSSFSIASTQPQHDLIQQLYEQYKKDQIVNEDAWGTTKRYNDDLTAYTYLETGICVDQGLGVVTFPGFQDSLPLPENLVQIPAATTQTEQTTDLIATMRSTLANFFITALMLCTHHVS